MSKKVKYGINKSHGVLSLKSGYITIARGAFIKVYEGEEPHPDFIDAERKGWLVYSDTEPTSSTVTAIPAVVYEDPFALGLTEEQLKAATKTEEVQQAPVEPVEEVKQVVEEKKTKKTAKSEG